MRQVLLAADSGIDLTALGLTSLSLLCPFTGVTFWTPQKTEERLMVIEGESIR